VASTRKSVFDLLQAFNLGNFSSDGSESEQGPFQVYDVMSDDWAMQIMKGGVIVKLSIGGWTGRSKLKPQDLGITLSQDATIRQHQEQLFNLGTKALCPERYIQTAESLRVRAVQALKEFAVETIFGPFMTAQAWADFKARVYPLRDAYMALGEEIVASYDAIYQEMSETYAIMAHEAWRRARRQGPDKMAPQASVDEYVSNIMAAFPTRDAIKGRFKFNIVPTIVPLPSLVADSLDRQNETLLEAAMKDDIKAHWHSQQKNIIDGFFTDLVGQIRGELFDTFQGALATMERNGGKLHGKTREALERAMEVATIKAPYDDPEMEAAFAKMRAELSKPVKDRSAGEVMQSLGDFTTVLRASLMLMDQGGRVGLADGSDVEIPSLDEVTQARTRLGVADIEVSPVVASAIRAGRAGGRSL
jgi:hypothetical protein